MHLQKHKTIASGITAVKNESNQFLFLRRSQEEAYGAGKWDFPGGAKEFLETPEEGALRECKEECGLDVNIEKLIWYQVTQGSIQKNVEFISFLYLCSCDAQDVTLSHEHDDYRWLTLAEAVDLDCVPWVRGFIQQVTSGTLSL